MSQLDLESYDYALDDAAGLHQPAPGKATLTSRLARPPQSPAVGRIDAGSHAHLEHGLGVELSRPPREIGDGGDDGGGTGRGAPGAGRRGLSYLSGGAEVGQDLSRGAAAAPAGRGLEYLGDVAGSGFSVAAKADAGGARPGEDAVHALAVASTGRGDPLPGGLRGSLESATGASLAGVRVHTDEHAQSAASSINARAFAMGNDIHFGAGQYDPASPSGQHLIAHEVAHTIQQSAAPRAKADGNGVSVSSPGDAFEVEADRFADAFVGGRTAPISTGASQTTAYRAPDAGPGQPPPGQEGARRPDGRREFPKNPGPPPADLKRTVQPPSAPVKPGDPGPNVKAPPGPPVPGQPLTAKNGPGGGAAAVVDPKAKKDAGKDKGGKGDAADGAGSAKDAKVDGVPPTKPPKAPAGPPAAQPPQPAPVPAVQPAVPVQLDDLGAVSEHEIKQWTQKTGRGPAEHRGEIEAIVATLNAEITSKQAELEQLGKDLKAEQEAASVQRIATFEAQIAGGRNTVGAAFDKITTGLAPLALKAKATVEASRLEGEGKLKTAETTKKTELANAFTAAETALTQLPVKEAGPYQAIFRDFAKGLSDSGEFSKKAVDVESGNIVNNNKPQDCAGLGVPAARESLRASIKQESAKNVGKDAKKKIDGIIKPAVDDINKNAAKTVDDLIKPYKDQLDGEVKKTRASADTNFAAAMKTAKDQLNTGAAEGNAAIDKAVGATKANIQTEKTTSLGIIDGAGKTAVGECKAAGTEIANRIEAKASKDAAELGALLAEAKGLTRGKRLNADKIKPKLDDILADAVAMHAAATAGLREMIGKGKADLDATIVKQEGIFAAAVTEQTTQANECAEKSNLEVTKAADGFALTNTRTVQSFDDTVGKDIAKVTGATATFNQTATQGLKDQEEAVRSKLMTIVLVDAKKQITDLAKTIPEEADKAAEQPTQTKMKGASAKATKLRACMDGWGTDESGIFGQLRDASYGEIELIEATYDEHYAHRAGKGMSPLRYDLWDEMSGNELAIARAYLDHDRDTAIKLELQDCCGWNDDEDRIEAILRSASDEELKTLASKEKATIDLVRDNMGGCDLDTVDALLDTDMDRERRLLKADAIRVFDAMEGIGTDEAKVKALLEACQTEEQRKIIREEFNKYAAKEGWGVAPKRDKNGMIVMGDDGKPVMMDALDSAIADDFSGHEANLVHALAEEKRDDTKIRVAKALFGGEGMGTDEHLMFEALDDESYAEAYEKADEATKKKMREDRLKDMNSKFGAMSNYEDMGALLDNDMGKRSAVTYEDIERGELKTGEKITEFHRMQVNLEREVAQAKLERGKCPPSLQLRYSIAGDGTDEKLIKDCLSKGGDPLPTSAVKAIADQYKKDWNRTLINWDQHEFTTLNFKGPGGDLNSDLSGDDWFDVRMLICGKPETPEQMRYVSKARVHYKTGGIAGDAFMQDAESIGYTDTRRDLLAQDARFDALYESIPPELRKAPLAKVAEYMGQQRQAVGPDGKPLLDKDGKPLPDDVFERYCEYLQADADAYGAAKASFIDAIVTALEIIGGVLVTIATAGAGSPVLAAIIGNLIVSAGGIILKKVALGEAYGADKFMEDAAMALLSAGVAAAEAKAFSKIATGVANKVVKVEAVKAAEEAGMELAEGGLKVASKGRALLNRMIQSGVKTVLSEGMTTVGQTLMSEEFWQGKASDALWGENSLLAKLITGIPKSMAAGMVRGAMEPFNSSRKSYLGSALASGLTSVGANTAGILCYVDSYDDASAFWDNLLRSNIQSLISGGFDGAAGHKARAKNLAEDFVSGRESAEELGPRAEYLSPDEMKVIAAKAAEKGKGHELPEAFKKYLPAGNAPADTGTAKPAGGNDTPPPPPPPPPVHADDGNDKPPPPPPAPVADADANAKKPTDEVDPNAVLVVDPNGPKPAHTDETAPKPPKPKMTPEELAADATRRANEDREAKITPEQRAHFDEIDQLAKLAKTKEDWEYIRELEAKANRPVSERHPAHDDAALLKSMQTDDYGKHADGTPVTKEEHDAAIAELAKDTVDPKVKKAAEGHDQAVKELHDETNQRIAAKDEAVKQNLLAKAAEAQTVDGPDGPRKEITVDAAISLGMGGAGAAGASGDLPANHDPTKPRTDRIGLEDETRPELWGTLGNKPMGQEADAISYGTKGVKTADVAEHPTAQPAKASELALQVAAQRDQSGVGTVGTEGPAGKLEFREVIKPDGTKVLEVGVPTKIRTSAPGVEPATFETVLIKTTAGVDISTGLGLARNLNDTDSGDRKAQISKDDAAKLMAEGKIMSGEKALAAPAESFEGQRVLGIGGGPTSEWAMEHAKKGGAASAEVAGAMPRPPKGSTLATQLDEVEGQIREIVKKGEKVPQSLTDRHHEIVTEHVMAQRARFDDIQGQLNDPTKELKPLERERLEQERDKIAAGIDPFLGSRVDRNVKTLNSKDIKHVQADVMQVKPTEETLPDGTKRPAIEVTYSDGTTRIVDKVIPSIGANPDAPGGINHMLLNAPPSMKLIPVISGSRCVGLESDPPGISISGAALTGTLGTNMPPGLMARIPVEMRDAVVSSLIDHANREGVSAGSKGIIPGIENVGDAPELTQQVLDLPPEQRKKALEDFLKKHKDNRDQNFDGQDRFPELKNVKLPKPQDPNAGKKPADVVDPNAVVDPSKKPGGDGTVPTKTGARTEPHPVGEEAGDTHFRTSENTADVTTRAKAKVAGMDDASRQALDAVMTAAPSQGHKTLIERALAAGHSMDEIQHLVKAMGGKSEAEVLLMFSGAGLTQFYHQSCVPTAYQIALAQVDPLFALKLRENPELMMKDQQEALINGGGAQTPRRDKNRPQLDSDLAEDPTRYSMSGDMDGIETTSMIDSKLHKQLEEATGRKYEVATHEDGQFNTPGHETFGKTSVPHGKIAAAVDAGLPVIISHGGHAQVIIGRTVDGEGKVTYIVTDPMSGKTFPLPGMSLDVLPPGSVSMPRMDAGPGIAHPGHVPGTEVGEATGGKKTKKEKEDEAAKRARDKDPGGRGTWHVDDETKASIDPAKKAKLAELEELEAAGVPKTADDLERMVKLRRELGIPDMSDVTGSPDHMWARWQAHDERLKAGATDVEWPAWSNGHAGRMNNPKKGHGREDKYIEKLKRLEARRSRTKVETDRGQENREIDVLVGEAADGRVMIQIKSGKEDLGTKDRQSGGHAKGSKSHGNKDALRIDGVIVSEGKDIVFWVFEEHASGPLLREAMAQGVRVIQRVDSAADEERVKALIKRSDPSITDEDLVPPAIQFVVGKSKANVVDATVARVKAAVAELEERRRQAEAAQEAADAEGRDVADSEKSETEGEE